MRAIFISYRREDAEGQAGRLFADLVKHFGEKAVFMDVATIEPGRDFRKAIDEHVGTCGVLLSLIGKDWLDAKDGGGLRRLDDAGDFVRLETASALKREIPVVPVLVHGASMPRAEQLPDDLRDLAYRNAIELTHARWDSDLSVLIKALSRYVTPPNTPVTQPPAIATAPASSTSASSSKLYGAAAAVVLAIAAGAFLFLRNGDGEGTLAGPPASSNGDSSAVASAPVSPTDASERDTATAAPESAKETAPVKRALKARPSLVGRWLGGGACVLEFSEDDGRTAKGRCDAGAWQHNFSGTHVDRRNVAITITRVDPAGCQTTVGGNIEFLSPNIVVVSQDGWNGCDVKTESVKTQLSRQY